MRLQKIWLVFLLLIIVSVALYSAVLPAPKRPWKAEDTFRLKSIRDLQVSPDSATLYFVISQRDLQADRSHSRLWALSVDDGPARPLTEIRGGVSQPRLSPDGKRIAFFSGRGGSQDLWIMNSDGSGLRKLTDLEKSNAYVGMRGNELCWSPDGKTLAYNAAGPRHYTNIPSPQDPPNGNDVMVVERILFKSFYYYSDMRRTYVYLISTQDQNPEPRQISFGDYDYHSITYSPDGKWIACVSNRTGRDDYNANNDICLLSTQGEDMIQLTHTIGPEYSPVWSPDGSSIVYRGRVRDRRSKESDAELHKITVIPSAGGAAVDLSAPLDRWGSSPAWTGNSREVYFTAQNSGRVGLYKAPRKGGRVDRIFEQDGQVSDYCLAPSGEIFFVYMDFTHPPEIYRLQGDAKIPLTTFHQDLIDEVDIVESEYFSFPSFDGVVIEGWIMKPYGFDASKKYPLIHAIHGGPHGQYGYSLSRTILYQFYAANGYAVVFMNYRGSSGRGQEFSDLIVGDLCGGEYKDLEMGIDYVIEKYPFLDSERLGVTGGSYGGYLTNWTITHTTRYKAAVPVACISDILTDWSTDSNPLWFESDGGFMPIDDFERAWNMSPIQFVKNCVTPTLFIHGAWDFCTNLNQAENMFTCLKKLGVDSVLAIYPNEGHGISRYPKHVRDYYLRSLAWFDKYLKQAAE